MGSHDILRAILIIVFWMICFFINIINIILWITFIISQKCVIFPFISAEFLILLPKFFCLLLLISWMLVRAIIFFATNITFFSLWPTAIILVIIAIVAIITLIVLITTIIPPKSTICKVLNISSVTVIVCYNRGSKLGKKFFKSCCRSKQCKFQFEDSAAYLLNSSNKLIFAYKTKI